MKLSKVLLIIVQLVLLIETFSFPVASAQNSAKTAYKTGTITREEYVVSSLKSYFSKNQLTPSVKSAEIVRPTREITLFLKEAAQNCKVYSKENQVYLAKLFLRPINNSYNYPFYSKPVFYLPNPKTYEPTIIEYPNIGGNFKFWYEDDAATDSNGLEHQLKLNLADIAQSFEDTYKKEVLTMGYPAPLSDIGVADNGGDGKFDVYIMNCSMNGSKYGVYGYTVPINSGSTTPAFMVIDRGSPELVAGTAETSVEAMQVTVAHEFHHAIQFAMNALADDWIMEATSTWIESEVYPLIHDNLQYLNGDTGFFSQTYIPLDDINDQLYDSWIFLKYLEIKWGADAIKDMWSTYLSNQGNGMTAAANEIVSKGSNLKESFSEFVEKNYSKTGFYPDAALYDPVLYANSNGLTLDYANTGTSAIPLVSGSVNHLAALYYRYVPGSNMGSNSDTLLIEVRGPIGRQVSAAVSIKNVNGTYTDQSLTLNALNQSYIYIPNFNQATISEVVLELINYSTTVNNVSFSVTGGLGKITTIDNSGTSSGGGSSGGCFIGGLTNEYE